MPSDTFAQVNRKILTFLSHDVFSMHSGYLGTTAAQPGRTNMQVKQRDPEIDCDAVWLVNTQISMMIT